MKQKKPDTAERLSERMRVFGWNSKLVRRIRSALTRERKKGDKRVMAERERCADIVKDVSQGPNTSLRAVTLMEQAIERIRSGKC